MRSYSICLSLSDLFHLAEYPLGQFMLSQIARFNSFFIAEIRIYIYFIYISLYIYLTSFLSIHLWVNILAITSNAAMNIGVQIPKVELLDYMAAPF